MGSWAIHFSELVSRGWSKLHHTTSSPMSRVSATDTANPYKINPHLPPLAYILYFVYLILRQYMIGDEENRDSGRGSGNHDFGRAGCGRPGKGHRVENTGKGQASETDGRKSKIANVSSRCAQVWHILPRLHVRSSIYRGLNSAPHPGMTHLTPFVFEVIFRALHLRRR